MIHGCKVVVCGDLGGTNSRLELHRVEVGATTAADLAEVGQKQPLFKNTYKNAEVDGDFTTVLHQFLRDSKIPDLELVAGCLAVAGPVSHDRVDFTNLAWTIDARNLEAEFLMPRHTMRLVNDFAANGYGVVTLREGEYDDISPTRSRIEPAKGAPVACVGAGTGLGETFATCSPITGLYDAWPSEGGHVGFAPRDELQRELLAYLSHKFGGRVSTERVVSGKGIVNVYEFLADTKMQADVNPAIDHLIRTEVEGALHVSKNAYDNAVCEKAMEIVLDCYGAELGNAAVKWLPFGGLYVAGGIAGKNICQIRAADSAFMRAYLDRGRVKGLLNKIPLRLVTVDDLGLRGAHYVALSILIDKTDPTATNARTAAAAPVVAARATDALVLDALAAKIGSLASAMLLSSALLATAAIASTLLLAKMRR